MKHGGAHAPGAPPVPTPMNSIVNALESILVKRFTRKSLTSDPEQRIERSEMNDHDQPLFNNIDQVASTCITSWFTERQP